MLKFVFMAFLCFGMSLWSYGQSSFQIEIRCKGYFVNSVLQLETADTVYKVTLNTNTTSSVSIPCSEKPVYGYLALGNVHIPLCLNNKNFSMDIDLGQGVAGRQFAGPGAKENQYLNDPLLLNWKENWEKDESLYMKDLRKIRQKMDKELESRHLDPAFVRLEKKRLDYHVYARLIVYPVLHKAQFDSVYEPGKKLCDKIEALIRDEEGLEDVFTYRETVEQAITFFIMREKDDFSAIRLTEAKVAFALKRLKNPKILDWFIHQTIYSYVNTCGIEYLDRLRPVYDKWVVSFGRKAEFQGVLAKWDKISTDDTIPDFVYSDIDGKQIRFSDMRGKLVYIDVWATWCGPCCQELPALQELEKKYAGKDICFVSISCDGNKRAWEKKVRDEQLGGIQLYMGADKKMMDYFEIKGIPRFILLDRNGKVINSTMFRPSNPETGKLFDKHLELN